MKNHSTYLYIFLGIFLVGLLVETIHTNDSLSKSETQAFQNKLHQKGSHTLKLINQIADSVEKKDITRKNFFEHFSHLFNNNDYVIFVYKNNKLLFWSDNTLPYEDFDRTNSDKVIKLGNGWYRKEKTQQGEHEIFGLALIKKVYPYENRFIKSHFQEDFNLPDNLTILKNPNQGFPVLDNEDNYLFSLVEKDKNKSLSGSKILPGILYLVSSLFLLVFIFKWLLSLTRKRNFYLWLIVLIIIIAGLRFLMISLQVPDSLYSLNFFDPTYYASSYFIPSLGDLILHLAFVGVIIYHANIYFRKINFRKTLPKSTRIFYSLILLFSNVILFLLMHNILQSIIYNSSFSLTLYNFLDFTLYSLLGILSIFLLLFIYFIIVDLTLLKFQKLLSWKQSFWLILLVLVTASLFIFTFDHSIKYFSIIFFLLGNALIVYISRNSVNYRYVHYVLLVLLSTLFVTYFIDYHSNEKETQKRKILVANLENERDRVGEYLLRRVEKEIAEDTSIKDIALEENAKKLESYITTKHFGGFFRKYDVQTSICYSEEDVIQIYDVSMENYEKCQNLRELRTKYGVALNKSQFYFLDNKNDQISYLGSFNISRDSSRRQKLFILLETKPQKTLLGYPELLLDEEITKERTLSEYSYAKYRNNKLIRQSGDYDYPLKLIDAFDIEKEEKFFNYENYNHLVSRSNSDTTIIISKPRIDLLDIIAQLSYIFVLFYLLFLILLFTINYPSNVKKFNYNFKNKVKLSMILLLIISLISVGTATVYYAIDQFRIKQKETISEKLESIIVDFENELDTETPLNEDYSNYLSSLLRKYSNIFYVDINLYGLDGNLIASSRGQVFERNLLGKKINPEVYQQLAHYDQPRYIHNEKIGELEYHSAYVPIYNDNNQRIAYLNLPYFTKQKALKKEIYTLVMVLVNIYVFLIILGTVTAVIVSNNITKPMRLIQDRLRQIGLNKRNEKIHYESHDEVGELISEYNRMVDELDDKAQQLAQSERESAWREMAKQIAHEIKNPLTPMKLKVQYLKRAWDDEVSNFNERLQQFTNSMINQIDTLSGIATEFSNFAKMPKAKKQPLDVDHEIQEAVSLYENTQGVEIVYSASNAETCQVSADKDQLSRVFNNLIKNAIQAIPSDRKGEIKLSTNCDNSFIYISIEDNGVGISKEIRDKLFNPNFTTKSTGVGMGLAISKKIIEDFDGKIWYETGLNKGTKFHIRLPRLKLQN
ncbi:MAG: ATP-binding protein [Bacteroidota bacterium]